MLIEVIFFMTKTVFHKYPKAIETQVKTALSYFPQLKKVKITFKFKDEIKKSTMQAQPKWTDVFKSKNNRQYFILISKKIKIENEVYRTADLPDDVLIGWLGHELGHIMDYKNRSSLDLLFFGIKYLFLNRSIVKAERTADYFAILQGMEKYILATKAFILENSSISERYRTRIIKYYLSPEEIMEMVEQRDAKAVGGV